MRVLLRLSRYAWRHPWYLAGAYVAMSIATLAALVVPPLLGTAVDRALESGLRSQLLLLALVVIGVSAVRAVFSYGQSYLSEALAHIVSYELRNDIFEKLQHLGFGFHDTEETGDLMSRATSDVDAVRWFISVGMIRGLTLVVMVVAVAALMLTTNWRLGLISLAFVPFIMWRAIIMSRDLVINWLRVQAETGRMTSVLQENLAGMRVVKAFGAREYEEARFGERAASIADLRYTATRLFASQGSLMTFILAAATGGILLFGLREVDAGRLSYGDMTAFILYIGLLSMPVRMTGWVVNTFSWAASAGKRLYEVLDAESTVKEKPNAAELPRVDGRLRFSDVSMTYRPDVPVIRDVSFEVEPGQMVAILGAPGSGKSTIVHLIPALLRHQRRQRHHRRTRHPGRHPLVPAPQHRDRAAGRLRLRHVAEGEHRLWRGECKPRGGPERGQDRPATRLHRRPPRRLRHRGRGARSDPVPAAKGSGWPSPAPC